MFYITKCFNLTNNFTFGSFFSTYSAFFLSLYSSFPGTLRLFSLFFLPSSSFLPPDRSFCHHIRYTGSFWAAFLKHSFIRFQFVPILCFRSSMFFSLLSITSFVLFGYTRIVISFSSRICIYPLCRSLFRSYFPSRTLFSVAGVFLDTLLVLLKYILRYCICTWIALVMDFFP